MRFLALLTLVVVSSYAAGCEKAPPIIGLFEGNADVVMSEWQGQEPSEKLGQKLTKAFPSTRVVLKQKEGAADVESIDVDGGPFKHCTLKVIPSSDLSTVITLMHQTCVATIDAWSGEVPVTFMVRLLGNDEITANGIEYSPRPDGRVSFKFKFQGVRKTLSR